MSKVYKNFLWSFLLYRDNRWRKKKTLGLNFNVNCEIITLMEGG